MAGCLTPFFKQDTSSQFPCGRCLNCLTRRVNQWSFRLKQEYKRADNAFFVTLTYDTDHVPITNNGYMSLDKKDLRFFWKKLRRHNQGRNIKYYVCGEYGGKFKRPHYHAIIFNIDPYTIDSAWSIDGKIIGTYHIGDVTSDSIAYCLKYMNKVVKPKHDRDDRVPEFSNMSNGLGDNYITEATRRYHYSSIDNNYLLMDGFKVSMPRYYREKLFNQEDWEERAYRSYKLGQESSDEYVKNMLKEYGEHWRDKHKEYIAYTFDKLEKSKNKRQF